MAIKGLNHPFGKASGDTSLPKLEQVISRAEQAKTKGWKYAQAFCGQLGLNQDFAIRMGPIKDPGRIIEKANARYNGDVEKVGDVCRLQILISDISHVERAEAILFPGRNDRFHQGWVAKGVSLLEVKNNFSHPTTTGWIGFNCKFEADLGKGRKQTFEVQIIPDVMLDVYQTSHTYLENKRAIQDAAAAQKRQLSLDEKAQIDNYSRMATELHRSVASEFGFDRFRKETPPQIRTTVFTPVLK